MKEAPNGQINDTGSNNMNNKSRDEKENSETYQLQPDEEYTEISQDEQRSGTGQKKTVNQHTKKRY